MNVPPGYVSDGCTFWLNRLGPYDWRNCCVQHDWDYSHLVPKWTADAHLAHCVNAILPSMGTLMWLGVATFGCLWYLKAVINHFEGKS